MNCKTVFDIAESTLPLYMLIFLLIPVVIASAYWVMRNSLSKTAVKVAIVFSGFMFVLFATVYVSQIMNWNEIKRAKPLTVQGRIENYQLRRAHEEFSVNGVGFSYNRDILTARYFPIVSADKSDQYVRIGYVVPEQPMNNNIRPIVKIEFCN